MRQQHNSVTVAPKYICNMAWGNPPPPCISLSLFLLFFNIKSWMHKMYRMFVHIKWWCCTDKSVPYLSCCTVWRRYSADFYVICDMDLAVCALSKLPLIRGAIDTQKQVRQNELREENLWTTSINASLSPLSCIVHNVFLTCKLRV